MPLPPGFRRFLRRPPLNVREEVEAELDTHLEMRARALSDAGLDPLEARIEAERRFGDLASVRRGCERVQARITRRSARRDWWDSFVLDIRYGARAMLQKPGFTALAVVTLGLGVGASTAVFTVVDAVLLRPLPFGEPDRLVVLQEAWLPRIPVSWVRERNIFAWRERSTSFMGIATHLPDTVVMTGESEPLHVPSARITSDLFSVLGVEPLLGRALRPEEERQGEDAVVVVSHGFWQRHLGSDPAVLGTALTLDGRPHVIVGVMGPDFVFPFRVKKDGEGPTAPTAELWVPLVRDGRGFFPYATGRLRPGVTLGQATRELDGITHSAEMLERYPTNERWTATAEPALDFTVGQVRAALALVAAAVTLMLLIASVNVSAMLVSRAIDRQREIELRRVLGASRSRIVRQLLTEGLLLACAAAALGLGMAQGGVLLLLRSSPPELPRMEGVALDGHALMYALGVTLMAVLLCSLLPALRASNFGAAAALRGSARVSSFPGRPISIARRRVGPHGLLVATQTAFSMVLLVGAGLLMRTFVELNQVDPGFRADGLLTATVSLSGSRYADATDRLDFFHTLIEETATIPGVVSVAAGDPLPFVGGTWGVPGGAKIEGVAPGQPTEAGPLDPVVVTPGYFVTLGIPLLAGRNFLGTDEREDWSNEWWESGQPVAIVSRALADRDFPGDDPIGKRLGGFVVVGVVGDVVQGRLDHQAPLTQIYYPFEQRAWPVMLIVRAEADPLSLMAAVRNRVALLDPDQPVTFMTMERAIANSWAPRRFATGMMAALSAMALLLVAAGVYGVVFYSVSRRRPEFGVRSALGASRAGLAGAVVSEALLMGGVGVLIGVGSALWLSRLISTQLYGVSSTDPLTFVAVGTLLLSVTVLASYLPARQAARVDPSEALRAD